MYINELSLVSQPSQREGVQAPLEVCGRTSLIFPSQSELQKHLQQTELL